MITVYGVIEKGRAERFMSFREFVKAWRRSVLESDKRFLVDIMVPTTNVHIANASGYVSPTYTSGNLEGYGGTNTS